jgi:RHS repeat-associated protein
VTTLVNGSGVVVERFAYDPFGAVAVMNASWSGIGSSAYAWQYLYQGGRLDTTTGHFSFRNRDYSPTLGRWLCVDPLRFEGYDQNFYRAVGNNPNNCVDPFGLQWKPLQTGNTGPSTTGTFVDPDTGRSYTASAVLTADNGFDKIRRTWALYIMIDTQNAIEHALHHLKSLIADVKKHQGADCACIDYTKLKGTFPDSKSTFREIENYFACSKTNARPCLSLANLERIYSVLLGIQNRMLSGRIEFTLIDNHIRPAQALVNPRDNAIRIVYDTASFLGIDWTDWRIIELMVHEVAHHGGLGNGPVDAYYDPAGGWSGGWRTFAPSPPQWYVVGPNKTFPSVLMSVEDCLGNPDSYGQFIARTFGIGRATFINLFRSNGILLK